MPRTARSPSLERDIASGALIAHINASVLQSAAPSHATCALLRNARGQRHISPQPRPAARNAKETLVAILPQPSVDDRIAGRRGMSASKYGQRVPDPRSRRRKNGFRRHAVRDRCWIAGQSLQSALNARSGPPRPDRRAKNRRSDRASPVIHGVETSACPSSTSLNLVRRHPQPPFGIDAQLSGHAKQRRGRCRIPHAQTATRDDALTATQRKACRADRNRAPTSRRCAKACLRRVGGVALSGLRRVLLVSIA